MELWLDQLPPLPQSESLKAIAPRLWAEPQVLALWLEGSLAAGRDYGEPRGLMTIHQVTPIARAIQETVGDHALETMGQPVRTRAELRTAIEQLNDEVARVGRQLAARLGFDYPAELEALIRRRWLACQK